ncbi:MAG: response regulator transcription factor [Candidatus Promineifilaceae bacterium]
MPKQTILIVDDEQSLRDFIRRNLDVRGYKTFTAANGLEALALFQTEVVDLVVLDLMMPHMNGLETLRRIRQQSLVPIIVLSALDEEQDKVQALNLGADDYLTKPFGVAELLARLNAVLRRAGGIGQTAADNGRIVRGALVVDPEKHTITWNGRHLDLTPIEYDLLAYLAEHEGKVIPHRTILQHVWGPEYGHEAEYLRVYIGRLRQKLEEDPASPRHLITERGIGYSFHA